MTALTAGCAAQASECRCSLDLGHDGAHHCQHEGCGGMWKGTPGKDFEVVRLPGEGRLLAADCRCGEFADAACPDHGLLAFLTRGIAAQQAIDGITDEGTS